MNSAPDWDKVEIPKLSQAQIGRLFAIMTASNWSELQMRSFIQEIFGKDSTKDLSMNQYDLICYLMPSGDYKTILENHKKGELQWLKQS